MIIKGSPEEIKETLTELIEKYGDMTVKEVIESMRDSKQ